MAYVRQKDFIKKICASRIKKGNRLMLARTILVLKVIIKTFQGMENQLRNLDDKILVTIYESNFPLTILGKGSKSFYVPSNANVHYLRTFITGRFSNSKDSVFLFAYGNILNNNQTMDSIQNKYRSRMSPKNGLQIQIASMASF